MIALASVIFPQMLGIVIFVILYMVFGSVLITVVDSWFQYRENLRQKRLRQLLECLALDETRSRTQQSETLKTLANMENHDRKMAECIREERRNSIGTVLMIPIILLTYVVWIQFPFVRTLYSPTPFKNPPLSQTIQNIYDNN
jgi:ABC-type multidrug transport system fused ATPase/permease subunit